MSLLLDALRKSENQRRKGELPPLDQPLAGSPVIATQPRALRLRTLLAAFIFLILAAITAWWSLDRWSPDEPAPLADGADAAQPSASLVETPANQTPEASARPQPLSQSPAESRLQPQLQAEAGETDEPPMQLDPDPPRVAASEAADTDAPAGTDERSAPNPETEVDASEVGAAVETVTAQHEEPVEASPILPPPEPAISEAQEDPPPEPVRGFIYAWELPLDARQDFPDLDLTVHVFAPNPDNRFVLINGERYGEGERLAAGVVLHEITREGALVDFRNYRILLQ